MSSSLNLVPDPVTVVVQAGIFLSNLYIAKKLIVEPYLKLKNLRESFTSGARGETDSMLAEITRLQSDLDHKLKATQKEISAFREVARKSAGLEKDALLSQASSKASEQMQQAVKSFRDAKDLEKENINKVVETLVGSALKDFTT